jgi:serine/threonine protein kinase
MVAPLPAPTDPPTATYRVKLLDMGVARVLQIGGQAPGSDSFSTLTQGGAVIGTADYVAPEQLEDPHGADIRADLYSLGCTFYFLLTGQVPFPGGSLLSKLDKQRWHMPAPIASVRSEIPEAVTKVARRLMEKAPAGRYQTPAELIDALTSLIEHNYTEPPPPRIEFTPVRQLRGHEDAVAVARWAPDGRHIASGGKDCTVILWQANSGDIVRRLPRLPQEVRSLAFAPAENLLATASGLSVRLWDLTTGQEVRRFGGHTGMVKCLAFTADGKRLLSGSDDKAIRLWEVATGREIHRYSRHAGGITALARVTGPPQFLSASRDQTIRGGD